jgi:hypothetical protein
MNKGTDTRSYIAHCALWFGVSLSRYQPHVEIGLLYFQSEMFTPPPPLHPETFNTLCSSFSIVEKYKHQPEQVC